MQFVKVGSHFVPMRTNEVKIETETVETKEEIKEEIVAKPKVKKSNKK